MAERLKIAFERREFEGVDLYPTITGQFVAALLEGGLLSTAFRFYCEETVQFVTYVQEKLMFQNRARELDELYQWLGRLGFHRYLDASWEQFLVSYLGSRVGQHFVVHTITDKPLIQKLFDLSARFYAFLDITLAAQDAKQLCVVIASLPQRQQVWCIDFLRSHNMHIFELVLSRINLLLLPDNERAKALAALWKYRDESELLQRRVKEIQQFQVLTSVLVMNSPQVLSQCLHICPPESRLKLVQHILGAGVYRAFIDKLAKEGDIEEKIACLRSIVELAIAAPEYTRQYIMQNYMGVLDYKKMFEHDFQHYIAALSHEDAAGIYNPYKTPINNAQCFKITAIHWLLPESMSFLKQHGADSVAVQKLIWAVNGWQNDLHLGWPVVGVYLFEIYLRVFIQLVRTDLQTCVMPLKTQFFPQQEASGPENLRLLIKQAGQQRARISDLWDMIGNNIFEAEQEDMVRRQKQRAEADEKERKVQSSIRQSFLRTESRQQSSTKQSSFAQPQKTIKADEEMVSVQQLLGFLQQYFAASQPIGSLEALLTGMRNSMQLTIGDVVVSDLTMLRNKLIIEFNQPAFENNEKYMHELKQRISIIFIVAKAVKSLMQFFEVRQKSSSLDLTVGSLNDEDSWRFKLVGCLWFLGFKGAEQLKILDIVIISLLFSSFKKLGFEQVRGEVRFEKSLFNFRIEDLSQVFAQYLKASALSHDNLTPRSGQQLPQHTMKQLGALGSSTIFRSVVVSGKGLGATVVQREDTEQEREQEVETVEQEETVLQLVSQYLPQESDAPGSGPSLQEVADTISEEPQQEQWAPTENAIAVAENQSTHCDSEQPERGFESVVAVLSANEQKADEPANEVATLPETSNANSHEERLSEPAQPPEEPRAEAPVALIQPTPEAPEKRRRKRRSQLAASCESPSADDCPQ